MAIQFEYDLDPVSFITVGTEGPPGQRVFFLQGVQAQQVVTLLFEKEQAVALATTLAQVLESLESEDPEHAKNLEPLRSNMNLLSPVRPEFRVAQLGLGVDEDRHLIILVAQEGDDDEPGQRARFVGTYAQMLTLARHITDVVTQGRPVCPLCGGPIDPEGHFCPRRNGHHHIDADEE
jgi:uncharacterized repeat protein (TIGR03847 family)